MSDVQHTSGSNFEFFYFKLQTDLMMDSRKRKGKVKVSGLNLLSSESAFLSANQRKVTKMRSTEKKTPFENLLCIKRIIEVKPESYHVGGQIRILPEESILVLDHNAKIDFHYFQAKVWVS